MKTAGKGAERAQTANFKTCTRQRTPRAECKRSSGDMLMFAHFELNQKSVRCPRRQALPCLATKFAQCLRG